MERPRLMLTIGAVLLALLALARAAGGVATLATSGGTVTGTAPDRGALLAVGAGLLAVGALGIVAAVLLVLRHPRAWTLTALALAAFVLGGAINGTVLFGAPTVAGTIGNLTVAVVIATCVLAGRRALNQSEPHEH